MEIKRLFLSALLIGTTLILERAGAQSSSPEVSAFKGQYAWLYGVLPREEVVDLAKQVLESKYASQEAQGIIVHQMITGNKQKPKVPMAEIRRILEVMGWGRDSIRQVILKALPAELGTDRMALQGDINYYISEQRSSDVRNYLGRRRTEILKKIANIEGQLARWGLQLPPALVGFFRGTDNTFEEAAFQAIYPFFYGFYYLGTEDWQLGDLYKLLLDFSDLSTKGLPPSAPSIFGHFEKRYAYLSNPSVSSTLDLDDTESWGFSKYPDEVKDFLVLNRFEKPGRDESGLEVLEKMYKSSLTEHIRESQKDDLPVETLLGEGIYRNGSYLALRRFYIFLLEANVLEGVTMAVNLAERLSPFEGLLPLAEVFLTQGALRQFSQTVRIINRRSRNPAVKDEMEPFKVPIELLNVENDLVQGRFESALKRIDDIQAAGNDEKLGNELVTLRERLHLLIMGENGNIFEPFGREPQPTATRDTKLPMGLQLLRSLSTAAKAPQKVMANIAHAISDALQDAKSFDRLEDLLGQASKQDVDPELYDGVSQLWQGAKQAAQQVQQAQYQLSQVQASAEQLRKELQLEQAQWEEERQRRQAKDRQFQEKHRKLRKEHRDLKKQYETYRNEQLERQGKYEKAIEGLEQERQMLQDQLASGQTLLRQEAAKAEQLTAQATSQHRQYEELLETHKNKLNLAQEVWEEREKLKKDLEVAQLAIDGEQSRVKVQQQQVARLEQSLESVRHELNMARSEALKAVEAKGCLQGEAQRQLSRLSAENQALREKLDQEKTTAEGQAHTLATLQADLSSHQAQLLFAKTQLTELENLESDVHKVQEELNVDSLGQIVERVSKTDKQAAELKNQIGALQVSLQEATALREEAQARVDAANLELERVRNKSRSTSEELGSLLRPLGYSDAQPTESTVQAAASKISHLLRDSEELEQARLQLQDQKQLLQEADEKVQKHSQDLATLQGQYKQAQEELATRKADLTKLQRKLEGAEAEAQSWLRAVQNYKPLGPEELGNFMEWLTGGTRWSLKSIKSSLDSAAGGGEQEDAKKPIWERLKLQKERIQQEVAVKAADLAEAAADATRISPIETQQCSVGRKMQDLGIVNEIGLQTLKDHVEHIVSSTWKNAPIAINMLLTKVRTLLNGSKLEEVERALALLPDGAEGETLAATIDRYRALLEKSLAAPLAWPGALKIRLPFAGDEAKVQRQLQEFETFFRKQVRQLDVIKRQVLWEHVGDSELDKMKAQVSEIVKELRQLEAQNRLLEDLKNEEADVMAGKIKEKEAQVQELEEQARKYAEAQKRVSQLQEKLEALKSQAVAPGAQAISELEASLREAQQERDRLEQDVGQLESVRQQIETAHALIATFAKREEELRRNCYCKAPSSSEKKGKARRDPRRNPPTGNTAVSGLGAQASASASPSTPTDDRKPSKERCVGPIADWTQRIYDWAGDRSRTGKPIREEDVPVFPEGCLPYLSAEQVAKMERYHFAWLPMKEMTAKQMELIPPTMWCYLDYIALPEDVGDSEHPCRVFTPERLGRLMRPSCGMVKEICNYQTKLQDHTCQVKTDFSIE